MAAKCDAMSERLNDIWAYNLAETEYGFSETAGFTAALLITPEVTGIIEEHSHGHIQ